MWIKNFRHKKLQTLMMFLIIALCSMLLCASVSILISLDKPFKDFAKECNSAATILFPYSHKDNEVIALGEQFAKLNVVKKVEYTRVHSLQEDLTFKGKKIDAFLKLTEFNDAVYGKTRYLQGNKNAAASLKKNECVIPASISNKYKIGVGDKLKIHGDSKDLIYTVKGVYSDPYNISAAFSTDILINKLPEEMTGRLYIYIYGKDGITGSKIEEAYREKYNGQMNGEMYTLDDSMSNSLIAINVVGGVFLAIGIIMLIVSCIIISFMIKNAMITDAKSIAVYKTIGYTSGDILKMYLSFYFVIVSAACILGIGSSIGLSDIILSSMFKNMGQVADNNILIPGIPCYVLITGFVLGIIYKIIGRTKKVKPVYALNGMTSSSTKKKKEYKGNSKMQFSALGIALRTLLRNKKGAIGIILTAIVTIFSINFAVISLDVAYTMKDNNDYWLGIDKCDVMISTMSNKEYEKIEKLIKEDSRVNHYLCINLDGTVAMKWKKGMSSTVMDAFVYDNYSQAKLPVIKGRNPEAGNEIAIGSKIAGNLKKSVGDYIEVYLSDNKKVNLLITGIFQTYYELGDVCRLTTDVYTENNIPFEHNHFSIYLKDKKDMAAFMSDMKKQVNSGSKVSARTETFSNIMDMIVTPQKDAIPPVVALVLLVGGINIFCIVLLKNATSEKTNSIYKSLGYSTWHLVLSNLYYVLMIAAASMAAALPMTIIFYPAIMKACLARFGFLEYPVTYNPWHIALASVGILVIFIISTLISSRSLRKVRVRDLVQE